MECSIAEPAAGSLGRWERFFVSVDRDITAHHHSERCCGGACPSFAHTQPSPSSSSSSPPSTQTREGDSSRRRDGGDASQRMLAAHAVVGGGFSSPSCPPPEKESARASASDGQCCRQGRGQRECTVPFTENAIFRKKERFGFASIRFGTLGKRWGLSPLPVLGREQEAFK